MPAPGQPSIQRVAEHGVVGAGGAGFPTAVKLQAQVGTVIVNAAECEPLLHKDKELLRYHPDEVLRGLRAAMGWVGAREGVLGIKEKYTDVIEALEPKLPADIRVFALKDTYPAGDEFVLVHDVTGRVIAPGGLPKDVDCVVVNVETLLNIGLDRPVTHKYLTVAGAVNRPVTVRVPVGTPVGDVLGLAGGATVPDPVALFGGVMMAKPARSLDDPITKTTGGVVVLPASHRLVSRYRAERTHTDRIGRGACDQCSFCTELCPRYLLGHPIEPHRAMQALGFTGPKDRMIAGTLYCCECNLCSLYACPEDLDPKDACVQCKPVARERELFFRRNADPIQPHPLGRMRRVPMHRLMLKLGLTEYRNVGPLDSRAFEPEKVTIPLSQHVGKPALAVVAPGDRVRTGQLIAQPPEGALGARLHASVDGVVQSVEPAIVIVNDLVGRRHG